MQPEQFVIFATPNFSNFVSQEYCGSKERLMFILARMGIPCATIFWPGLQFIEVARNALVARFLRDYPDATDLFFIDDDVAFEAEKAVEIIQRSENIVCGVYPAKIDGYPEYMTTLKFEGDQLLERNGLYAATAGS